MANENFTDKAFSNICRGLGQLLTEGNFCDVCVVVGEKQFSCHRVVLASVSTFCKTSLMTECREGFSSVIDITHDDVSPKAFECLMDVLYRGTDVITKENAKDILRMCVYLQIKFLEDHCVGFLCKNLIVETCLETWQFAQKYDLEDFAEVCYKMAVDKIKVTAQQEELLTLPKSMVLILLSLQTQLSADDICKIVFRWVEAKQDTRAGHLTEFLPFVCFPLLSSQYLCELVVYFNHPFREVLFDKINDALTYNMKGVQNNDATVRKRILARQPLFLNQKEVQSRVVMIGGYEEPDKSLKRVIVFNPGDNFYYRYSLAPLPEDTGLDFASCTWNNEVYVSGGSQLPTFFAVYKPGDNEWEVLPSLPGNGREKHAMAANNSNVFVFGGLEKIAKSKKGEKVVSSSILKYCIKSKEWGIFCQLPLGVQETTAAVVGHRIYLFGGVGVTRENTDMVQCVDTLNDYAYQAGRLPAPMSGARAVSNGGHIYVATPTGDILRMWERFSVADEIEKEKIHEQKLWLIYLIRKAILMLRTSVESQTKEPTVRLKEVAKLTGRRNFGVCLIARELILCGGENEERQLMNTVDRVSVFVDKVPKVQNTIARGSAKFDLHVVNIPLTHLTTQV